MPMHFWMAGAISLSTLGPAAAHTRATVDAGRGPVPVLIPDGYRADVPVPLVLSLHGFGGSGEHYVQYWEGNGLVDARGFIVVAPTGTTDSKGRAFWNATDACCDKDGSGVDDARYLRALIDTVEAAYAIDPQRVHVTGYSNGGFMAHRMACDHPDKVASIASIAGAGFLEVRACGVDTPVHILQVHGLEDEVIRYGGGRLKRYGADQGVAHPGAVEGVSAWATRYGATRAVEVVPPMDLSARTPGPDTQVLRFQRTGPPPVTVELWSIAGETHVPKMTDAFHEQVTAWLLGHRRPAPK